VDRDESACLHPSGDRRYHVSRQSRQKSYFWLKRRAGLLPVKLGFGAVLRAGF
jgi:hypothetical protein